MMWKYPKNDDEDDDRLFILVMGEDAGDDDDDAPADPLRTLTYRATLRFTRATACCNCCNAFFSCPHTNKEIASLFKCIAASNDVLMVVEDMVIFVCLMFGWL